MIAVSLGRSEMKLYTELYLEIVQSYTPKIVKLPAILSKEKQL